MRYDNGLSMSYAITRASYMSQHIYYKNCKINFDSIGDPGYRENNKGFYDFQSGQV